MASGKEIRAQIKSISNTRKITSAMEMVAASKMRKAQDRMAASRPYSEKILAVIHHLAQANPELMTRYLTDYCVSRGELVVKRWRELGEYLLTKYNDGYIKDDSGSPQEFGYPEGWLRKVLSARPDQFRLKEKEADVPESKLVD